jgi:hypothetical protein
MAAPLMFCKLTMTNLPSFAALSILCDPCIFPAIRQYTLSLDVSSQHEAGGVLVSYERIMWEDVMMQLDEGIGVSNLMIERSDTGDVISSEAHWQVCASLPHLIYECLSQ